MSQEDKRLIINCGSSHILAAEIAYSNDQLKVEKTVSVDLDYDYQDEGAWLEAISYSLKEIVRDGRLSGKASFIIPGNQVLTKSIRIPHVDQAKQNQVLAYEAQQNLPYDLDEVVWDSQILNDDGIETEVLLGACKEDTIEGFCQAIKHTGLIVESINASTVLDQISLEYTNPELDEEVLLINVGARSSNLLFKNDNGFFVRTVNLGGNTLSQYISDTLGKDFQESEEIKHRFFLEEDSLDSESSAVKLMHTCISNFSRRFAQEVSRSIVMYRRQKGGESVKKILITGKGAYSKTIRDNLSQALNQEVQLFDVMSRVEVSPQVSADSEDLNFQLSEVIGEAIHSFNLVRKSTGFNLLPLRIQQELKFIRQKPLLLAASVLLGIFPWLIYLGINQSTENIEDKKQSIVQLAAPYEFNSDVIASNRQQAEAISLSISQVEGLMETKTNWIQFFADLQDSIYSAKDVWIDDLTVSRPEQVEDEFADEYAYDDSYADEYADEAEKIEYEVVVKGKMLVRETADQINQDVLANRIKQLQSSFEDSSFVDASKPPKIIWKYLSDGLRVLPFEINLIINSEKPL
jgi:type IV pilus assembly protein PilM